MPLDRFTNYHQPGITDIRSLSGFPYAFQIGQAEGKAGMITAHAIAAAAAAWCEEQFGQTEGEYGRWVRWSTVIYLATRWPPRRFA
jgi:hypothetical protein